MLCTKAPSHVQRNKTKLGNWLRREFRCFAALGHSLQEGCHTVNAMKRGVRTDLLASWHSGPLTEHQPAPSPRLTPWTMPESARE